MAKGRELGADLMLAPGVFARTSKALTRLNDMLRKGDIHKTYWALVEGRPEKESDTLENWLKSDGHLNKTFISSENDPEAKKSTLRYRTIATRR